MSDIPPEREAVRLGALPAPTTTSTQAVASLVCALLGVCTAGLGAVAGLILGVLALRKIRQSDGRLGGHNLAVAGIIGSVIALVTLAAAVPVGWLMFSGSRAGWNEALAQDQIDRMRRLCGAARAYTLRHDGRLPPSDDWVAAMREDGCAMAPWLASRLDEGDRRVVAMNARLDGMTIGVVSRPGRTVLFFECAPDGPQGGGRGLLPAQPYSAKGYVIGFVDGHVERVPPGGLGRLAWEPKMGAPVD